MALKSPRTASLDALLDQTQSVIAGLEAVPSLAPLAKPWHARKKQLREQRDARDDARWAHAGASRKFAVLDAMWDGALVELSGLAFLDSGKDANAGSYGVLFGGVSAAQAIKFGPAKATVFADDLLAKAAKLANPALKDKLAALGNATKAVREAGDARDAARTQSLTHEVARVLAVEGYDKLVGETEAGILTKHPSRKDLVRAALGWPTKEPAVQVDAGEAKGG
ncbi:MAG: hypothetical protein FJ100_09325 [Deltaproteobacteria bacterium]|nr:hypothetical protein [Deltaproteobacteria bacterium]